MAKTKRIKLPKTFAGYKLTKGTRRKLRQAMRVLDSPVAKALIASGIGALATHFAERRERLGRPPAKAPK